MGPIDVADVRRAARQQRVVPHPHKYHAGRHGLGFVECVTALEHCYAVHPDPRHEKGWYALASHTHGRRIRVDFGVVQDPRGHLLLVVTAYHT